MNLVSSMVGLSIMGAMSPVMMDMSIAPIIASKRAQNLGIAESAAVTFAAANEGETQLSGNTPDGCEVTKIATLAYGITCTEGEGTKYVQTVTRSFRLAATSTSSDDSGSDDSDGDSITFPRTAPAASEYTHYYCPGKNNILNWPVDSWGVAYYNRDHQGGKYCIPEAAQGGIDPDDDMSTWLWDLRPVFGYING